MIIWSDESKFNVFGTDDFHPTNNWIQNTQKRPLNIVWGGFTASGVGPLLKIDCIIKGKMYRDISETIYL